MYKVRKILSPSSCLPPLSKTVTHPAARSFAIAEHLVYVDLHRHYIIYRGLVAINQHRRYIK